MFRKQRSSGARLSVRTQPILNRSHSETYSTSRRNHSPSPYQVGGIGAGSIEV